MSKADYDIVIGLEIHAELNTNTKIFCGCKNKFGQAPNTCCCAGCLSLPGTLPILNKKAVELAIKAGLTVDSKINDYAIFERKNYFYPDISKAYQISQLEKPICVGGHIQLDSGKIIRLNRIHLEEDAGKLVHGFNETYVDYNRGSVPLIESVTEPDISSADEAIEFLTKLRNRYIFADVAHCKMEQGGMRCDVNLSVKPKGSSVFGTRTEMKNLNSFRSVARAIEYESNRQIEVLEAGGKLVQETRKWDDEKGMSFSMRSKEDAQDYRYFPDPDILTVRIDPKLVEEFKQQMPLTPEKRKEKYINEYNFSERDAGILVGSKIVSDFFEKCVSLLNEPKEVANWVLMEVLKYDVSEKTPISAERLVEIIKLALDKKVSRNNAKVLFEKIIEQDQDVMALAKSLDMVGDISDADIENIINTLIAENPKAVADFEKTPDKVCQFFIGNVMKQTKGKANAGVARNIILKKLQNM